jgi:hypothetical protein
VERLPVLNGFHAAVGSRFGVPTEKIDALDDYAKSPLFTEAEKVALEYADAITDTGRDVDDELFARLQRHYDDDTVAELTMIIRGRTRPRASTGRSESRPRGSGSVDRRALRFGKTDVFCDGVMLKGEALG